MEGKEILPGKDNDQQLERGIISLYLALVSIIKWITNNKSDISQGFRTGNENENRIGIRYKYKESESPLMMNFLNTTSNEIEELVIPTYESSLRATRKVKIPYAYAIPDGKDKLLSILHNHGFASVNMDKSDPYKVQSYLVLESDPSNTEAKPRPPTNVRLITLEEEKNLSSYVVFNTSQEGGRSLPLLLEPQSEYGLARYKELNLDISPMQNFEVLRIIDKKFRDTYGS